MARTRVVLPGVVHHVVTRGNNRRLLFARAGDYLAFIGLVRAALRATACLLHGIALLSNHVHWLLTPPNERALPSFVKRVCQRYAQVRNHRRGASGKLFEQRYYSKPIMSDLHMAIATVYVDLNGKRAGLVHGGDFYPWSTHALHAGRPELARIPPGIWTPTEWYLALGASPQERAREYMDFVAAYESRLEPGPILGLPATIEALSDAGAENWLRRPDNSRAA